MPVPLISTKLYVPRVRPDVVLRERLLQRVSHATSARVVVVSAPPGFGKTTLLAEWVQRPDVDPRLVAWLSLDGTENEPALFWNYVVASLRAAVPALADLVVGAPLAASHVVATIVNALAGVEQDVWLVLDDFHQLDNGEVLIAVGQLIDHLPAHVHLLIGTRQDPDLPLSRWRARGELVEVRAADLRFTADETAEYLRSSAGLDLSAAQTAHLAERAEGWVAALQLAALSMRGHHDVAGFIERFAGDDRYLVDYLMDEVLSGQSAQTVDFLLRTAVLDRLSGSLCDAVTERNDSAEMLSWLERANLFVVPLDDQAVWFRYHHLFVDLLRARLLAEQPEMVRPLHRRASTWFEAAGLADEAISHALAAGDVGSAARLVELELPEARRSRQDARLTRWLQSLPIEVISANPVLTTFHGWTLMASGDLEAVESRLELAESLLADPASGSRGWAETEELRTLPATIAIYRASLAQARGDLAGAAAHARRALELIGPDDHLARGAAAGFLALVAWSAGEIGMAVDTFTSAIASLRSAGATVDELAGTALLAEMVAAAGRPAKARQLCRTALRRAEELGAPAARAIADLHVQLAELDLDDQDLDAAGRHLAAAEEFEVQVSGSGGRHRWFMAAARVAESRADFAGALEHLAQAEALYQPGYYPQVRPIPALRARVLISAGELAQAAEWALDQAVTMTDEADYLAEYDELTLARLILADQPRRRGELGPLITLLERLEAAAQTSGRLGSLTDIRRQLARAVHAAGAGLAPSAARPALTERELQVLRLLDSELSGPEIARTLFVSDNTLRTHTKHIFTKLDVTSRRAAIARGRERGLL
ncbi:LuxR family maltose regulon positive regulatory protein [Propionicimonas paludicola]|uniref:LuxR family maltose regulon positive regulatory protein n=1 Tax=Propionicimonas paludicola TaxID=185243 RepID=A0A2A9CP72_9ACTN|nr:LuxR C-terminal-related transcriptional regulator [Propionicimonas paludicola]PFG16257.1 LuxR family maltose regulon positive regulatory protein [Propionicimonas paludicola]